MVETLIAGGLLLLVTILGASNRRPPPVCVSTIAACQTDLSQCNWIGPISVRAYDRLGPCMCW